MAAAAVLCRRKRSFFAEDLPRHIDQIDEPARTLKKARFNTYENPVNTVYPNNGEEWIQLLIREMSSATSIDDASARAAKFLGAFESYVTPRAAAEAEAAAAQKEEENAALKQQVEGMAKESAALNQQVEGMAKENAVLKRFACVQNERLKEFEGKNQELENLKGVVNEYKEKVGKLEVDNYGLKVYLTQALQGSSSMPSSFNPHVF